MNFLKDYFIQQANLLDCEFSGTSLTKHPTDTGENREFLIKRFLDEHLPFRSPAFIGGRIFDSFNIESDQMDLIIYNNFAPRFHHLDKTLYMVEGVYAAIEIKPELTKTVINGSKDTKSIFDYCLSAKKLSKEFCSGSLTNSKFEPMKQICFGVFAYNSDLTAEEVIKEINGYYQQNGDINNKSKIDFLCVNKKFTLIFNRGEWMIKNENGTKEPLPENQYIILQKGDLSLWAMFLLILKQIDQWIHLVPDYFAYMKNEKTLANKKN